MKTSPQAVKIYKRLFPADMESKKRFLGLMRAFQQGIVLADNIFLSYEDDSNKKKSDNLLKFFKIIIFMLSSQHSRVIRTNLFNCRTF